MPYDDRVAELLLQDAFRTGTWDELPDDLQEIYGERRKACELDERARAREQDGFKDVE